MAKALYIHWPFCARKCPYCDFNSHVREHIDHDQWRDVLIRDMRYEYEISNTGALTSIFFGGGTPSLMPSALVEALLHEADRLWGFAPDIEITLEANPSSVEAQKFAELAHSGINRLSLGVQSFNDDALRFLGRLHDGQEARAALDIANRNFSRVSFDLIYALPTQSLKTWCEELATAISFSTSHLSLYQLTIEPGTRFESDVRRGVFAPMDPDLAADFYTLTQEMTTSAGLPAYEISNHARPGQESRHNLTYWRYQDYIGIGPGAHGRRKGHATARHRKPENYLAAVAAHGHGIDVATRLNPIDAASEALLMGLRLNEGVDLADVSARFELTTEQLINASKCALYEREGLVWRNNNRVGVTKRGFCVLDAILGEIVNCDMSP